LAVTIQVWTVEQMKKNTERSIGDWEWMGSHRFFWVFKFFRENAERTMNKRSRRNRSSSPFFQRQSETVDDSLKRFLFALKNLRKICLRGFDCEPNRGLNSRGILPREAIKTEYSVCGMFSWKSVFIGVFSDTKWCSSDWENQFWFGRKQNAPTFMKFLLTIAYETRKFPNLSTFKH
jgi:hypothetical protein